MSAPKTPRESLPAPKATPPATTVSPEPDAQRDRLWTETEAATYLGLQTTTLQKWRWAGTGPRFVKLGTAVRYRVVDLLAFIDASLRVSTTDEGGHSDV